MKARRDTLLLLLAAGLRSGGALLLALALTRLVSPEAFGEFRGAQLLATFSISFLVAGIPQSLLFLYPTSDGRDRDRLVGMTFLQLIVFATLLAGGLWIFAGPVASGVSTFKDGTFVACAALLVLGQALSMSAPTIAVARGELRRSALLEISLGIVPILAAVVPAMMGASARTAILALGAAHLVVGGLFWARMMPSNPAQAFRRSLLRRQWSLAAPQTLNSILGSAAGQADKLLVAALFRPAQFAIYACGAIEVPLVTLFPYVVTKAISPRLARMYTSGRISEFLDLWHHAIRVTALVLLPACLMLALASDLIISILFPAQYAAAVHPFRVFLLLIPLRLTGYGLVLQSTGTARAILWAGGSGLVLNLGLAWMLIPVLGPVGAAWSAVVGQSLSVVLHLAAIRGRLGISFARLLPARVLVVLVAATGAAGAAGLAIRGALDPLPGVALCCAVVPGIFFALAFVTRTMSLDDVAFVLPRRWASAHA